MSTTDRYGNEIKRDQFIAYGTDKAPRFGRVMAVHYDHITVRCFNWQVAFSHFTHGKEVIVTRFKRVRVLAREQVPQGIIDIIPREPEKP